MPFLQSLIPQFCGRQRGRHENKSWLTNIILNSFLGSTGLLYLAKCTTKNMVLANYRLFISRQMYYKNIVLANYKHKTGLAIFLPDNLTRGYI